MARLLPHSNSSFPTRWSQRAIYSTIYCTVGTTAILKKLRILLGHLQGRSKWSPGCVTRRHGINLVTATKHTANNMKELRKVKFKYIAC